MREQLHFKCNTELFDMQSSNIDAFKKAFGQGCPKFVTAAPPDMSEVGADNYLVGYHEALRLFVSEVCSNSTVLCVSGYCMSRWVAISQKQHTHQRVFEPLGSKV